MTKSAPGATGRKPVALPSKATNTLGKPASVHALSQEAAAKRAEKLAKKIGDKLRVTFITGTTQADESLQYISTGHQVLDDAISGQLDDDQEIIEGTGKGLPRGRIVEIFGKEASCKTSLGLSVIAEAQRRGEQTAFIDVEHALHADFARKLFHVDMASMLWCQPDDGEEALKILDELVEAQVAVIVLDSVAALVSRTEAGGGKALGEQARLMSIVCRKLTAKLKPGGPLVIFLNQTRMKIGVMFGNPEVTSGGQALLFYSSVRLRMNKKKDIKKTSKKNKGTPKTVGVRVGLKVVKNKVAPVGGSAEFTLDFRRGIRFERGTPAQEDDE